MTVSADQMLSEYHQSTHADEAYQDRLTALTERHPGSREAYLELDATVGTRLLEQHGRTARFLGYETDVRLS